MFYSMMCMLFQVKLLLKKNLLPVGVSLSDVDMKTMQSRICSDLYFAGEVLDIDGITGGFNFQAAWTTGYIAGKLIN